MIVENTEPTPAGKGKVAAWMIFLAWLETTPEGRAALARAEARQAAQAA